MPVIKAVLREEYKSALKMEKEYDHVLNGLPKGALVKRVIRGSREYYYIMERKGDKISYKYVGKVGPDKVAEYEKIKKRRAQYRNLRSQLKIRIKYLKGVLRGKREI
jgi:hypothetical protein